MCHLWCTIDEHLKIWLSNAGFTVSEKLDSVHPHHPAPPPPPPHPPTHPPHHHHPTTTTTTTTTTPHPQHIPYIKEYPLNLGLYPFVIYTSSRCFEIYKALSTLYHFLNTNKRARQRVHQTYVGDGRTDAKIHNIFSLWLLYKPKYKFIQVVFGMNTSYIHRAS